MNITIMACGVFQLELDQILPDMITNEFPEHNIRVVYFEMALHNEIQKLKTTLSSALDEKNDSDKIIVLYGYGCHPEIKEICEGHCAYIPIEKNCIDMFISEEEKQELSKNEEVFFLTDGWFSNWRSSLLVSGWDTYDARMNFGRYDSFMILNTQMKEYTDEEIVDFFEYTTIPIEIEPHGLDRFVSVIRKAITSILYSS